LTAKRLSGGYVGQAPDGYLHVRGQTEPDYRREMGRIRHWIEPDPKRADVWREAWALLLTGKMTLSEIAETLYAKGYQDRNGKPFVVVKKNGEHKPLTDKLRRAFQDWTYAGWVVSECDQIAPKTLRGNWEPIISTDDFEMGLAILQRLDPSG
jgi:hypothetical protein